MIEFRSIRTLKGLLVLAMFAVLAGCKATEPTATTPLWNSVDVKAQSSAIVPVLIDQSGHSWEANNAGSGGEVRLIDPAGVEQWRLALAKPVVQLVAFGNAMLVQSNDNNLSAVDVAGNVLWQQTAWPVSEGWIKVKTGAQGHIQLSATQHGQVKFASLEGDGSLRWSHPPVVRHRTSVPVRSEMVGLMFPVLARCKRICHSCIITLAQLGDTATVSAAFWQAK